MKLCNSLVVAAIAISVPFLLCSADRQGKLAKQLVDSPYTNENYDRKYANSDTVFVNKNSEKDYASSDVALVNKNYEKNYANRDAVFANKKFEKDYARSDAVNKYESSHVDTYDRSPPAEVDFENQVMKDAHKQSSYTASGSTAAVIYKYVKEYEFIWNDRGSGSERDVSIWRPIDIESGFYPLGDVATGLYTKPVIPAMTVSEGVAGALAKPTGSALVWDDSGSGADKDVRIYRLIPPRGYLCLGDVAVSGNGSPDLNKYRCVKTKYVSKKDGSFDNIWDARGSGAKKDVYIYSNTNINSVDGRIADTFSSSQFTSANGAKPNLLRASTSEEKSAIGTVTVQNQKNTAIIVYQTTRKSPIWSDYGSGADVDFSVWRVYRPPFIPVYFSLGDIAVATHSAPYFVTLVKAVKPDALAAPLYYRQQWTDIKSGARNDVAFYEPVCPRGYRALGYVAIASYYLSPSTNDVRCVNRKYTVSGTWQYIWNDAGSGARQDVTVYQAVSSGSGQGVKAMFARPCHCDMISTAYVLNSNYIQYIVSKPVKRYAVTNINYNLYRRTILSTRPEILANTYIQNSSPSLQTNTRIFSYQYQDTHSWSISGEFEVGVTTSYTAYIPKVSSSTVTLSEKARRDVTEGESITERKTDQISSLITVSSNHSRRSTVTATRYVVDVPFSATLTPEYYDGTYGNRQFVTGKYKGDQVHNISVILSPEVPLYSHVG